MNLAGVESLYRSDERTARIAEGIKGAPARKLHLAGLVGSAGSFAAAAVYRELNHHHLFILNDRDEAGYFADDLRLLLGGKEIHLLPGSIGKNPGEVIKDNILRRIQAVTSLRESKTRGELLVTYPEALAEKFAAGKNEDISFETGGPVDMDELLGKLVSLNFEHEEFVYEPGQFAIRGGIIDVFSYGSELPVRIELAGRTVESIRTFDPAGQLSIAKLTRAFIIPDIQTGRFGGRKATLREVLPENTVIWIKDASLLFDSVQKMYDKVEGISRAIRHEDAPVFLTEPGEHFETGTQLAAMLESMTVIEFSQRTFFKPDMEIAYRCSPQPSFNKSFSLLIDDYRKKTAEGITNVLFCDSPKQIERFYHIFGDLKADVSFFPIHGSISSGFCDNDLKISCYTDHQVFNRYHRYATRQGFSRSRALLMKTLSELKPGDFVTHIDHGVGVFSGLEKIEVDGNIQEMVRLVYRNNDLLYVSISSLNKISRFVGKEGTAPKVHRLGSNAWENLKSRTKRKIKDIARDLIRLYAKRRAQKAFTFSPDTYLQDELEASFLYEDTQDQLKATQAVKKDMEAAFPMDRLICGDVGFGKTEIAIRAAFKAVADSKQAAVLVPTTILALQHYKTFSSRLKDFPASVEFVNRFKSPGQKKKILRDLAEGKVDIIIGTQALLGKQVRFRDLGLVVIDEEQKFGVAAKEKLRAIKVNVDTLTLTATPIPRTLQFSLMGARDLSVIQTPPPNRQDIHTEMHVFDDDLIRESIYYEANRGGQVFFIHNRVKDINEMAALVQKVCPDLKVAAAHGQMEGHKLEQVMQRFIEGEYDILVSTNIVESGLDIPNVNTIIINNAQNFGLSDLHQLRGRVGRSDRKAFCYLFTPPLSTLTTEARKRLETIIELSSLGSGFGIALRDLDIRGAGNLLGGEQSGFIAEIGLEMYQKILDEAIRELKKEDFKELFKDAEPAELKDCQIETDTGIYLPDGYVSDIQERLKLYSELAGIRDEKALQDFAAALTDRFGPVPAPVQELFHGLRLRWAAVKAGFDKVDLRDEVMKCYFIADKDAPFYSSPAFHSVLDHIRKSSYRLKETGSRLILIIPGVRNLEEGAGLVAEMVRESVIVL